MGSNGLNSNLRLRLGKRRAKAKIFSKSYGVFETKPKKWVDDVIKPKKCFFYQENFFPRQCKNW